MFIAKEDYLPLMKSDNLNLTLQNDDTILLGEESQAIETVKSYLFERYDTALIFEKIGVERNLMIVRHCVNIVLYNIYQRIPNARDLPLKTKNYEETITFLERVADGKVSLDLPRLFKNDGTSQTKFRGGSNQKQNSHNTDFI
jgi:phage gp36-like protein